MREYKTKIYKIDDKLIKEENIEGLKSDSFLIEAAELLKKGELVAFPTETVYGLGADATNPSAVEKIYLAKERPQDNPLIVHIANLEQLDEIAKEGLSNIGEKLTKAFWPGPLTIIVSKKSIIPDKTTAGLESVAVRMPNHPLTRALIEITGLAIAAPSANKSGAPSPTKAFHVINDLSAKIPLIIDGGSAEVGVESTVVDIRGDNVKILRPGGVSREEIKEVIGGYLYESDSSYQFKNSSQLRKEELGTNNILREAGRPVSPGMKYRHYSPETPLYIIENEDFLKELIQSGPDQDTALVLSDETYAKYFSLLEDIKVIKMGPRRKPAIIASNIFELLRSLDKQVLKNVYIEAIPEKGIGEAVMNRIRKASIRE